MFDPSFLLGHAKTSYTHHPSPISLPLKPPSSATSPPTTPQDATKSTPLSSFTSTTLPACRLNPLLFNGHLQTIHSALLPATAGPAIHYKRRLFTSTHSVYPGIFTADFVIPAPPTDDSTPKHDAELPERTTWFTAAELHDMENANANAQLDDDDDDAEKHTDTTPMLVCLHGLTGGSHETYLRCALAPLLSTGWSACVLNARGCARSLITTPYLFNARSTYDLHQLVLYLRATFPSRPLFGIGFSLGANILTNYVGEQGAACMLKAAVAVSNPWNLEVCNAMLCRTVFGREVYSRALGRNTLALYERHKEVMVRNERIDVERVGRCRYLYEFDRYVEVIQAPTWGYPTEGAYYRDSQSCDALLSVRIPFLAINAEDDPISAVQAIPYEEFKANPYTILCTTNWGGHLGWFQVGGTRWFATAVAAFLTRFHEEMDGSAIAAARTGAEAEEPDKKYPIYDPNHRRLILPAA
ncbi:medium-chain fatty acid ethyl ester synthase/esteras-like protein 1 [Massariosphaeria phaeospora]|uniref:Medium-chain fatty acid ethyl ester synthase/esteras-like protein 1 n=1 Tax=Massariosphaeria phaeospora TaxID=100035 RepID=A0A7C8I6H9_9PLEO|nr:medium-chain fatty acid ethyl ester synthase/esteras-like protein 1 [Massariosphaeria phaeospora]